MATFCSRSLRIFQSASGALKIVKKRPLNSGTNKRFYSQLTKPLAQKELIQVQFRSGDKVLDSAGKEGDSLLDVVVNNEVPLDGFGACEGTLACSTCHVVLKQTDFDNLPDTASDEELDMLDLAYGLTDTSRLGCQIILTNKMNGLKVDVPDGTYDARLT